MTLAHLLFAIATTGYILLAIQFEEADLVREHRDYEEYRRSVPMLVPFLRSRPTARTKAAFKPESGI
jgi:protein-S-isoprenylcysteine O-methyltransferase Ste14